MQAGGGIHTGQLHCPFSFTVPQHLLQCLSIGFILDDAPNNPLYCVLVHVIILSGLELGVVRLRAPGRAAAVTFLLEHVADHKAHEAHEEEDQYKQEEHVQPMLGRLQVRLWFRHEALGGERGPGRRLELEGCSGGWIVAPCSGLGSVFRGVLRLGAPGAFPALIPCSLPLPPSPPHRLRAAAAVPCRGRLGGGKDGEGWMLAGREPRQIPDNSCPGKWKRWEGKGGRLSRPGFPNAFALGGPGTKGRSAGVRGGEQKPSARVSASGVRA